MLREIPRLHPNSVLFFLIIPIDISVFSEFFPSQRGLAKLVENIGLFQQLITIISTVNQFLSTFKRCKDNSENKVIAGCKVEFKIN